jgi:hypothetical protein
MPISRHDELTRSADYDHGPELLLSVVVVKPLRFAVNLTR